MIEQLKFLEDQYLSYYWLVTRSKADALAYIIKCLNKLPNKYMYFAVRNDGRYVGNNEHKAWKSVLETYDKFENAYAD